MTDREKLTALIGEIQTYGRDNSNISAVCKTSNETLADHLLSNGVTVQRWIPVTERLPDVGVDVLVVKDNGDKNMAVWRLYRTIPNGQPHWEDEVGDGLLLKAATHWMPLPEPPADMRKGENG